ncbi:MAG TPA: DNA mismatch repair endonuclease MutL [Anaerolineaceae bacterium]|nr:DNA mismatch repair endonuclease MutL [Anaerolineaceae bacterium]
MPIQILPDEVASQIAAGEVVERPASVVKELLENSIDAGAKSISIRIEQAGRRLVEMADDGQGISPAEMELAIARHATSKLRSAHDLFRIATLGFRGEALASIGSVSRLTLTSCQPEAPVGSRLRVEGGRTVSVERVGVPTGTVIQVEDLFYNVPARLKFLKQDATERQQINGLVSRYALAYPQVRVQLVHDGKPVLHTNGKGDRREILAQLYGVDIARQLLEVLWEDEGFRLEGFISPIALTRSNRREITFFVNGRWVQDAALISALLKAYHTLLMVGRYPMAVLFLNLPPDEVDVNVHPAKAEVRFRNPDRVFTMVQRGVKRALLAYSPVPELNRPTWTTLPWGDAPRSIDLAWGNTVSDTEPADLPEGEAEETPAGDTPELPSGQIPLLRLVGQVGAKFLVAEGPDGLYLIDQHAAHERVLFEWWMRQRSNSIPAQRLLEPVTVQLSAQAAALLEPKIPVLNGLGFEVEGFGPNTYRVRAVPVILTKTDPAAALRVVVEDFEEDETPLQAQVEAQIAARVCKRAAVKAGQAMSDEEQRTLLRDLESCQSPRTCPHGRPTMIHLSVDLLERQFGRRGSR